MLYLTIVTANAFLNSVFTEQKKHLKVIKAQLDTNSVFAFSTNSNTTYAHIQKGIGNFVQDSKKMQGFFCMCVLKVCSPKTWAMKINTVKHMAFCILSKTNPAVSLLCS